MISVYMRGAPPQIGPAVCFIAAIGAISRFEMASSLYDRDIGLRSMDKDRGLHDKGFTGVRVEQMSDRSPVSDTALDSAPPVSTGSAASKRRRRKEKKRRKRQLGSASPLVDSAEFNDGYDWTMGALGSTSSQQHGVNTVQSGEACELDACVARPRNDVDGVQGGNLLSRHSFTANPAEKRDANLMRDLTGAFSKLHGNAKHAETTDLFHFSDGSSAASHGRDDVDGMFLLDRPLGTTVASANSTSNELALKHSQRFLPPLPQTCTNSLPPGPKYNRPVMLTGHYLPQQESGPGKRKLDDVIQASGFHSEYQQDCASNLHQNDSSQTQSAKYLEEIDVDSDIMRTAELPEFARAECRYKTFGGIVWSLEAPTVDQIVSAGLFYIGPYDRTRCFVCGGILLKWEPSDEPFTEHGRHFPNCPFTKRTHIKPKGSKEFGVEQVISSAKSYGFTEKEIDDALDMIEDAMHQVTVVNVMDRIFERDDEIYVATRSSILDTIHNSHPQKNLSGFESGACALSESSKRQGCELEENGHGIPHGSCFKRPLCNLPSGVRAGWLQSERSEARPKSPFSGDSGSEDSEETGNLSKVSPNFAAARQEAAAPPRPPPTTTTTTSMCRTSAGSPFDGIPPEMKMSEWSRQFGDAPVANGDVDASSSSRTRACAGPLSKTGRSLPDYTSSTASPQAWPATDTWNIAVPPLVHEGFPEPTSIRSKSVSSDSGVCLEEEHDPYMDDIYGEAPTPEGLSAPTSERLSAPTSERLSAQSEGEDTDYDSEEDEVDSSLHVEDIHQLKEENEVLKMGLQCKVCLEADATQMFLACGHLACCSSCAGQLSACPLCRKKIVKSMTVYMAY